MAHSDPIPKQTLQVLASQIAYRLETVAMRERLTDEAAEIAESFTVWILDATLAAGTGRTFRSLIHPSWRWHHQLRVGGAARLYARSAPLGSRASSWILRETVLSSLAAKIDAAVRWIDENVEDDPMVRLFHCPQLYMTAFWLAANEPQKDRVLVVETAPGPLQEYAGLLAPSEFLPVVAEGQTRL